MHHVVVHAAVAHAHDLLVIDRYLSRLTGVVHAADVHAYIAVELLSEVVKQHLGN